MDSIKIVPGESVLHYDKEYKITRVFDLNWVIGEEKLTGKIERLRITDLLPTSYKSTQHAEFKEIPFEAFTEKDYEKAQSRYNIIEPLLESPGNTKLLEEISKKSGKSITTIYRWLERYRMTGKVSSLVPLPKGGKGLGRISNEAEQIIKASIENTYLTRQNKSIQKTCNDVVINCRRAGITPPHLNTIRNRISQISDYNKAKGRLGKKEADKMFSPKIGAFPLQAHPLSIVQIDHTKLDIIVVDELNRKPIGRPWITLAVDIFSRMVVGFYISMDSPGTLGTGLCISNSILPKDGLLTKFDIKGEWPCWGVMKKHHLDNAKEFRGESLHRSCSEYSIELTYRPVATPQWGGHIERLLGTFLREIHSLPGTTFSNPKQRKDYDSVNKATFTLDELDKWLTTLIVEVYHNRTHSSLGISPLNKYKQGIFGHNGEVGTGIPSRNYDPVRIKLDFLPSIERTIQDYGVLIEHIYYYNDVLRRWINSTEPGVGRFRAKRKFIFKRDPRDISIIYFLDPDLKEYFPISYRDITRPSMSLWEFNEIMSDLLKANKTEIQEEDIFEGYERLKKIEEDVVQKSRMTKQSNMKAFRREDSRRKLSSSNNINEKEEIERPSPINEPDSGKPESFDNLDF